VLVWADYFSMPQKNTTMQRLAIRSLPAYVASSHAFVICAPDVPHAQRSNQMCNLETYRQRMWCRVEQLSFMLSLGPEQMYVVKGPDELQPVAHDSDSLRQALYVFEGEATDESDKLSLVPPLLGLYAQHLVLEGKDRKQSAAHALFSSSLSDVHEVQRLFPQKVIVQWVLRNGERTRVPKPKAQTLFGDLPKRTREKVLEAKDKKLSADGEHTPQAMSPAAALGAFHRSNAAHWQNSLRRLQAVADLREAVRESSSRTSQVQPAVEWTLQDNDNECGESEVPPRSPPPSMNLAAASGGQTVG